MTRGRPEGSDATCVLALAPERVMTWVDAELRGLAIELRLAWTVRDVVAVLTAGSPPHPQVLIADLDALGPAEVMELHAIRQGGWFGMLIAIGQVSDDLRASLNIGRVLDRPLASGVLRKSVVAVGLQRATTRIPQLKRPK